MKTKEEIEQLADEWLAETPIKEWGGVENGFIIGYQKCQEDGKDKKYTEEDIIKAIEMAREGIRVTRISEWETEKEFEYNDYQIIQLLNKKD
jgi:hypothetical protein